MSTARYLIGDSLTVLRSLPDASVDLVLSSPPFLALRSYLPPDHPEKALEMGSEPTPGAFAGSGTTLAVATGHGRDAIGIDLDARNLDLARQRVGMFLREDEPTPATVEA